MLTRGGHPGRPPGEDVCAEESALRNQLGMRDEFNICGSLANASASRRCGPGCAWGDWQLASVRLWNGWVVRQAGADCGTVCSLVSCAMRFAWGGAGRLPCSFLCGHCHIPSLPLASSMTRRQCWLWYEVSGLGARLYFVIAVPTLSPGHGSAWPWRLRSVACSTHIHLTWL